MDTQTIKHLTVEAVMADGTVKGKTIGAPPGEPEELLSGIERMNREAMQREYPDAVEVRSSGWRVGEMITPDQPTR